MQLAPAIGKNLVPVPIAEPMDCDAVATDAAKQHRGPLFAAGWCQLAEEHVDAAW